MSNVSTYRSYLVKFMSFRDGAEYDKDALFEDDHLSTITPHEIVTWLRNKVYGADAGSPGSTPSPPLCRWASLMYSKKAVSYFMPDKAKPWDPILQHGNPTRAKGVFELLREVKELEDSAENSKSKATLSERPSNLTELWKEYTHGIDDRKPAKDFTEYERKGVRYRRRKVIWDVIENMMQEKNITADAAIAELYETHGADATVAEISNSLDTEGKKRPSIGGGASPGNKKKRRKSKAISPKTAPLNSTVPVKSVVPVMADEAAMAPLSYGTRLAGMQDTAIQEPGRTTATGGSESLSLHDIVANVLAKRKELAQTNQFDDPIEASGPQEGCQAVAISAELPLDDATKAESPTAVASLDIENEAVPPDKSAPTEAVIVDQKKSADEMLVDLEDDDPTVHRAPTPIPAPKVTASQTPPGHKGVKSKRMNRKRLTVKRVKSLDKGADETTGATNVSQYRSHLFNFMAFRDEVEYTTETMFSPDVLSAIKPNDIVRWLNKKAYGTPDPGDDLPPSKCRSASLEYYKKAISHFIPDKLRQWDEDTQGGNPARSEAVNTLIKGIRQKEKADMTTKGEHLATLSERPRTLQDLWREFQVGIGDRKPAKDFTAAERESTIVRRKYRRRKVIWDMVEEMIHAGQTAETAIDQLYQEYGGVGTSVNVIIDSISKGNQKRKVKSAPIEASTVASKKPRVHAIAEPTTATADEQNAALDIAITPQISPADVQEAALAIAVTPKIPPVGLEVGVSSITLMPTLTTVNLRQAVATIDSTAVDLKPAATLDTSDTTQLESPATTESNQIANSDAQVATVLVARTPAAPTAELTANAGTFQVVARTPVAAGQLAATALQGAATPAPVELTAMAGTVQAMSLLAFCAALSPEIPVSDKAVETAFR